MKYVYEWLRFAEWALEAIMLPPLALAVIISASSLIWAGIRQRPFRTRLWRPYHWFVFCHLFFFPAAISVAVFGVNHYAGNASIPHPPIPSAAHWLNVVEYGSLASCVFWAWRMKGFRWYAASLMVLLQVVAVEGAVFIASMAITGEWL